MSGWIRIQEAVEVLKSQRKELLKDLDPNGNVYGLISATSGIMVCAVGQMNPTQPEIIRCQDCAHSEYDAVYGDRYCHYNGKAEIVPDNHFCGYAERRETDEICD